MANRRCRLQFARFMGPLNGGGDGFRLEICSSGDLLRRTSVYEKAPTLREPRTEFLRTGELFQLLSLDADDLAVTDDDQFAVLLFVFSIRRLRARRMPALIFS